MRKLFMIAAAAACLMGISPANAQYYYYGEDYYLSPWRPVIVSARHLDCGALNEIPNFRAMDRNDDGHISKWEFTNLGSLDDFVSLDLNGNGILTRGEINEYRRVCD